MFAKVSIPVDVHEGAVVIPRSAVIEDRTSGKSYIFVVNNDTSARREVQLGIARSDKIEILSNLDVGEKVVILGQHYLKDGERVKVVNASE